MEDFYQYSVFDIFSEPLKIDKPIRLIELFAGIGSQAKALERIGADFEHYRVCEFDKYAIKSYNAIHGTDFETSDITKLTADDLGIVDTDKYCYMVTYSFPCQDLSLAGKQKGMAKGENTRSGLLWEVERLLNECEELPQILLMENVTQVHGKKNMEHFQEWIEFLESKGYSNYWKDLNAKNFGIPQNRNRTFMVSVLGNYTYEFPKEFLLELRLKDMLEDSVEEKFYISNEKVEKIVNSTFGQEKAMIQKTDVCGTLLARDYKDPKCVQVGTLSGGKWDKLHDISRRVYSGDGVALTIHTSGGGQQEPKVVEPAINVVGNYSPSGHDASRIVATDGLAPTVKENHGTVTAIAEPKIIDDFCKNRGERVYADCSPTLRADRVGLKVAEPFIVASRGRNPDNPSDRTPGIPLEQRLEPNFSGCSNTLTTVQKDNYVAEPLAYDEQNGYIRKDGTVETLTTDGSSPKHNNRVVENMRIRKLTPKECWRLMGFDDTDFEKAAQHNSNSQLYKQAGNSIVVDVLAHIFTQMF